MGIQYFLRYLNDDYLIFNNIRLKDNEQFFQMDTLIVTSCFIFILEVKNIIGTLYFDEEFDRRVSKSIYSNKETAIPS
ncbi:nuclease-related domain-containing protein [Metabacillus sp. Hm71]|uniref:nuclease-related domain-containing protein n=1 Tax=Metabacillus sp. Hm71 TaxID=3450743 RepID=UPI003F435CC0